MGVVWCGECGFLVCRSKDRSVGRVGRPVRLVLIDLVAVVWSAKWTVCLSVVRWTRRSGGGGSSGCFGVEIVVEALFW